MSVGTAMAPLPPPPASQPALSAWRDLVMPREHGSWSLALEPLALGLLVAPSPAGALLAPAVVAAFFARRPLRIAGSDGSAVRRAAARRAVFVCGAVAGVFFLAAVALGGLAWTRWLAPSAVAGAVFLAFDLRRGGREEPAEIAGSAAFAFLPVAFATAAGWPTPAALAVGLVMLGRSVPTVMTVRACLRRAKTGIARPTPALAAAALAFAAAGVLAGLRLVPVTAAVLLGLLAVRSGVLLVFPRPEFRARTLGMTEAAIGGCFIFCAAAAWRL